MSVKNILKKILMPLFFIGATSLSFVIVCNTREYKNDAFYKCTETNNKSPIIAKITNNTDNKLYEKTFDEFNNNLLVSDCRYLYDNQINDEDNNKIQLFTQKTFSINNNVLKDGGHLLDYNTFVTYYADDILGKRGYLERRYDCDSFIFINDTYANLLLEKYGISSYEELIKNEKYCVLELNVDDETTTKVCINNILYSNKKNAVRASQLNKYFGLIFNFNAIQKWSKLCIELDLKNNKYNNEKVIKTINSLGFNSNNSTISFLTNNSGSYEQNEQLNNLFSKVDFSSKIDVFLILFILYCCLSIASIFLIIHFAIKEDGYITFNFRLSILCFIIYGIIVSLFELYYFMNIFVISLVISLLIITWKTIFKDSKRLLHRLFNRSEKNGRKD